LMEKNFSSRISMEDSVFMNGFLLGSCWALFFRF
jgi:hypothetical protein